MMTKDRPSISGILYNNTGFTVEDEVTEDSINHRSDSSLALMPGLSSNDQLETVLRKSSNSSTSLYAAQNDGGFSKH